MLLTIAMLAGACGDEPPTDVEPKLIFKFRFDEQQQRLNNFGLPANIPVGHAAQTPVFRQIGAHYIELAPSPITQLGNGEVVYMAAETTQGGEKAIDFAQSKTVGEGEVFLSIPLEEVAAGTYTYLRTSLSYQNYDIAFKANGMSLVGTLASFIGYNTYIGTHQVNGNDVVVNANRKQGYWAFSIPFWGVIDGQIPEGAITVPNPLNDTSPIPIGSCVVTGGFVTPLIITGNETADIVIVMSLSTNNSFEWTETQGNTIFEPLNGDVPVDMGIRGLVPLIE